MSIDGTEDSVHSLNFSDGRAGPGINGDGGAEFPTAGDNIGGAGGNRVALRRTVSITAR